MRLRAAPMSSRNREPGLVPEHDVLPDGEVVGQHEVLEHHADARRRWRRGASGSCCSTPLTRMRALVGAVGAVERSSSASTSRRRSRRRWRGWCRACTARFDAVVGHDAREALDDVAQLDGRCAAAAARVTASVTAVVLVAGRDGAPDAVRRPARCSTAVVRSAARLGRDRDLAADDVRLQLLERAGVLVDVLVASRRSRRRCS